MRFHSRSTIRRRRNPVVRICRLAAKCASWRTPSGSGPKRASAAATSGPPSECVIQVCSRPPPRRLTVAASAGMSSVTISWKPKSLFWLIAGQLLPLPRRSGTKTSQPWRARKHASPSPECE